MSIKRSKFKKVIRLLSNPDYHVVAQINGKAKYSVLKSLDAQPSEGEIISALKRLGFESVFDVDSLSDFSKEKMKQQKMAKMLKSKYAKLKNLDTKEIKVVSIANSSSEVCDVNEKQCDNVDEVIKAKDLPELIEFSGIQYADLEEVKFDKISLNDNKSTLPAV